MEQTSEVCAEAATSSPFLIPLSVMEDCRVILTQQSRKKKGHFEANYDLSLGHSITYKKCFLNGVLPRKLENMQNSAVFR